MEVAWEGILCLADKLDRDPQFVARGVAGDLKLEVIGPAGMSRRMSKSDLEVVRSDSLDPCALGAERAIKLEILDRQLSARAMLRNRQHLKGLALQKVFPLL